MCRRDPQSFLKHECETNPWPNCKEDLPKIITAAKDNLQTLFYGALSASGAFAGGYVLSAELLESVTHASGSASAPGADS